MIKQRAAAYIRVSTGQQERDGDSLDAQLDMARRWCAARGMVLVQTYVDTMSGQSGARPGLLQLEADVARGGTFDHLLVYRLDRLWRNSAAYHALLARLETAGVGLSSLTENFDATTPIGKLLLTVLVGLAEMEVGVTSDRIRDSLRYRAEQGRIMTNGTAPLGYRYHKAHTDEDGVRHPGRFTVDEEEAEVVRWFFRRYLETRSTAAVINEAVALGIRSRNRPFSKSTTLEMLKRSIYKGVMESLRYHVTRRGGKKIINRRPKDERVSTPGMPAIIDVATWDAVQAVIAGNANGARRWVSSRLQYVWTGLLRCGSCGAILSRQPQTITTAAGKLDVSSYRCRRRTQLGLTACAAPGSVPISFLTEVALPALFAAVSQTALAGPRGKRPSAKRPKVDQLAALLADIERKREAVQDMREDGRLTREKYRARMDRLDGEEADARKRHAPQVEAPPAPPTALLDLADVWRRLEGQPNKQHDLLATVLQGCDVDPKIAGHGLHMYLRPYAVPGWPEQVTVPIVGRPSRRVRVRAKS